MRAALLVAVVLVVALGAALGVRTWRRTHAEVAPVTAPGCSAREVKAPPLLPELSTSPLFINATGVTVRIDGAPAAESLAAGEHLIEANAGEARAASFRVKAEAFQPVLLDARVVEGAVAVLVLNARCTSCAVTSTDIDLRYAPRAVGSEGDAAAALSSGNWQRASEALRAVAPEERGKPQFIWLNAALLSFAGRASLARATARTLPPGDPLQRALSQLEARAGEVPERTLATAVQRWNAAADRFDRLTVEFSGDAPELMTQLTVRFAKLSEKVGSAVTARDAIETQLTLEAATAELDASIAALRAQRDDCAWQQRITATF